MRRRAAWSRGFTLTEVLIVLVVLGLILGFSGTNFDSYRRLTQLQNEVRALSAQIQKAQLTSLVTSASTTIDQDFVEGLLREAVQPGNRASGPPTAGLAITVETAMRIGPDGSCSEGAFMLDLSDFRYALKMMAPLCDATITRIK